MSTPDAPYPDLLGPDAAPERRHLVADLDQVCAASRLDADRDRAIARLLHDHATAKNRQMYDRARAKGRRLAARDNDGRVLPVWVRRHRALAAVAMLATVIFLGGTFAALRGHASVDPARPLLSPLTSTAAASLGGRSTTAMTTISMQPSLATSTLVSGMSRVPAPPSRVTRPPATTATPVSTPTGVFSPSPTS